MVEPQMPSDEKQTKRFSVFKLAVIQRKYKPFQSLGDEQITEKRVCPQAQIKDRQKEINPNHNDFFPIETDSVCFNLSNL